MSYKSQIEEVMEGTLDGHKSILSYFVDNSSKLDSSAQKWQ